MNMNHYITDWSSSMGDTFAPLGGEDDDRLIELMWCNGHVVMQARAPRKPPRPDKVAAHDDDEAAAQAWSQYPVEDPLERADLFAELFGEAQAAVGGGSAERGGEAARQSSRMMPPPPPPPPRPAHATREDKACPEDGAAATATDGAGSSVLTIGSSFRGRNHAQPPPPPPPPPGDVAKARDAATTRARSCTTKSEQPGPGAARRSGKRKQSDATDAEDAGLESADATCEPTQSQRMTTAKRRRAAQVHNLSERRRRDRINEKMKALQELIPHCNKADKASMLDEAIEYLKSLQLQLQMMWMGGGIVAPPPPPVVHQYMQRTMAAAARAPPHVASLPAGMPAFAAPPAVHAPPAPAPDLYARYVAVDHLPPSPPSVPPPPPYTVELPSKHRRRAMVGAFYPRQNPALPATSPSDRKYAVCGRM